MRRSLLALALTCPLVLGTGYAQAQAEAPGADQVLDNGRQHSAWRASASDQVSARLRPDRDGSLCLDYDFNGVSGYAVMRRELPVAWPEAFDLHTRLKGQGGRNELQFKLVDASGDNVWWVRRPDMAWPQTLTAQRFKRRHVDFAWGPTADRTLRRTQFVEWVVVAGRDGGRGSLCVDGLRLRPRAPEPATWPEPVIQPGDRGLQFDFSHTRDFNGVVLTWPQVANAAPAPVSPMPGTTPPPDLGRAYELLASDDGRRWRLLRKVQGSRGVLDTLFLPEQEARHLRVLMRRGSALPQLQLRSPQDWPDLNAALAEQARALPRGDLPRAFLGEQNYWTLVGVDGGGGRSALLSEDGALEVGRGGYSVEPSLLLADGRRLTWADLQLRHSLPAGHLPLPVVHAEHDDVALGVQAAADVPLAAQRPAPQLLARYTLHNRSNRPQTVTLQLALRPWQVNPPQQFLTTPGGTRPVARWRGRGAQWQADGAAPLRFTRAPDGQAVLPLDAGLSLATLQAAVTAAPTVDVTDPQRHASALLQWRFTLAPGQQQGLGLVVALAGGAPSDRLPAARAGDDGPPPDLASVDHRLAAVQAGWQQRLGGLQLQGGPQVQRLARSLRTALAHMLVSRDGAALRPGTRSYARTWIRDGAMMVAGLVRLGERQAAQDFVDWFAPHVFASGKVPCCVDSRGADPVVENDSHGQYLFAVAELLRHGAGEAWARHHWPVVQRVLAWQEALRQSERGDANRTAARAHLFGLMPPSISHEGYSDKPAYSYWDNFWALRGYKDAVFIAHRLGQAAEAERWATWRDEFQRELAASVAATARVHGITFVAGAADRGDFDATSTTMALNPAQASLPHGLLDATFDRYWHEMSARSAGTRDWKAYTPYELRTVGALARLGRPAQAHALLDFFFADQRPAGWNQWAEVVTREPRRPEFLGDMPHAWVASDYVRSALDLLAFDDERSGSLVIGAGWRADWLQQPGADANATVLRIAGLHTPFGELRLQLQHQPGGWLLQLPQALPGLPGGVRLRWPDELPLPAARLATGAVPAWAGRELLLPAPPFTLHLRQP